MSETEREVALAVTADLTIPDAVVLAVLPQVLGGRQEVVLHGGDGAVRVIVQSRSLPLVPTLVPPPLQAHQELVDVDHDGGGWRRPSWCRTLQQADGAALRLQEPTTAR